MEPVGIAVGDVVVDVARGGDEAEGDERGGHAEQTVGVGEPPREQHPTEDEGVLDPLLRPHEPEHDAAFVAHVSRLRSASMPWRSGERWADRAPCACKASAFCTYQS